MAKKLINFKKSSYCTGSWQICLNVSQSEYSELISEQDIPFLSTVTNLVLLNKQFSQDNGIPTTQYFHKRFIELLKKKIRG